MTARLQRDIEGRATRRLAGRLQRLNFGVRPAEPLVPALADEGSVADHDRAHERVRLDEAPAALGQLQGAAHPVLVGGFGHESHR
jgi:hypothetical protein